MRVCASHASARSVLSDVKSLRGIHSARSACTTSETDGQRDGEKKNSAGPLAAIPEVEFIPPKISIVDDKKGIREELKIEQVVCHTCIEILQCKKFKIGKRI